MARVYVRPAFGGVGAAEGNYLYDDASEWRKGTTGYVFLFEDSVWSLYYDTDEDLVLEAGTGGDLSSPATATWLAYTVFDLEDAGKIEGATQGGGVIQAPGSVNPKPVGLPDVPDNYVGTFAQSLSDLKKDQARQNIGATGPDDVGEKQVNFYDAFQRAATVGTMGTADCGKEYLLNGSGLAGVTVTPGRYRNLGSSGASYAFTGTADYWMCGGRFTSEEVTSSGSIGSVYLILTPTAVIGPNPLIHAQFSNSGVIVHVCPTGVDLSGANEVLNVLATGGGTRNGEEVDVSISVEGDTLTAVDPRLEGGTVTVSDPKIGTISGGEPMFACFEVFGVTTGDRSEFSHVWASSNPAYNPSFQRKNLIVDSDANGRRILPASLGQDKHNQDVEFPGNILAHRGAWTVPVDLGDIFGMGSGYLNTSGGDLVLEPNITDAALDGLLIDYGDSVTCRLQGKVTSPNGTTDLIRFRVGTTDRAEFIPAASGDFDFTWTVRKVTVGDPEDPADLRYFITYTGIVNGVIKQWTESRLNMTNLSNVQLVGTVWAVYHGEATWRRGNL